MGKYPIKERVVDYSIKGISLVCGIGHFTGRLIADGFKELEAAGIHAIDKGCSKEVIRRRRDFSYAQRMRDVKERMEQTKKVMEETYQDITQPEPEGYTVAQIIGDK
jgi:hypothetical protein